MLTVTPQMVMMLGLSRKSSALGGGVMVSEEEGMEEGHLPTPHPLTTKAPIK